MTREIPEAALAELRKLNEAQIFALLGEIVDASIHSPFDISEELTDALMPVSAAYRAAYRGARFVVEGE